MALFNWFSKKEKPDAVAQPERAASAQPGAFQAEQAIDLRKQQRHARREQLYVAIREAMTRSGVLATGYKFKVLSLDQLGNEFMVMVDLAQGVGSGFDQLSNMEAGVIKNARERFEITVPTVYWRLTGTGVFAAPAADPGREGARSQGATRDAGASNNFRAAFSPRHAIADDEVAAFNRALLAASSKSRPGSMAETVSLGSKSLASPPLMDFADTEMTDGRELHAMPALGKTQYGDLN